MNEWSPAALLEQLRQLDECSHIEAKRGNDIGGSIMQTVCAFANEPGLGGGYLLLGVNEPDEQHTEFYVSGVDNTDKLLGDLQANCREQFEQAVPVEARAVLLEGKTVIVVFIPELDPAAKPCTFKGKYDAKNKRKTGVWRRGLNGDYECTQADIEPLLLAKSGQGFEQVVLPDSGWDDLDADTIALYRTMRSKVRVHAEELQLSDPDMLRALNLVKQHNGTWVPNIAGLLLFGKPLSLRRLLPSVRVDYVRVSGTHWVEDPHQRFDITLDLREPLLRLIPKLENAIVDDLPKHFRLNEGDLQRSDEPLLPYKVIREAVVNAVMHRDYSVHQPTMIVRYSNRIEIRNAGYSLKPANALGETGSALRNPILAAVLYDLQLAETKGTGIRTMRRLLQEAGLEAPVFKSLVIQNQFISVYLLHQLLGEAQLTWLQQFTSLKLSGEEAKALILAKETGAVDVVALHDITGLSEQDARQLLRRLVRQAVLIEKSAEGMFERYQLASGVALTAPDRPDLGMDRPDLGTDRPYLGTDRPDLKAAYNKLTNRLAALSARPRKEALLPIIVALCLLEPQSSQALAARLNRDQSRVKKTYLKELLHRGLVTYRFPESANHPEQAYIATDTGKQWLEEQGMWP
ncbi:ATP-binding protein [Zobellella denitrificans]